MCTLVECQNMKFAAGSDVHVGNSSGDTDKIEEIVEQPARLPCVQRDKENVDRAQVQRQIVPVEIPADLQTDLFERLVREQENGKEPPQLRPLLLVRRLVELAAQRGKADIQRKRH